MRNHSISSRQVFVWLLAISVVFVLLPRRLTEPLDHLMARLTAPFSGLGRALMLGVTDPWQKNVGSVPAQKYQQLERRAQGDEILLNNLRQELDDLRRENERLSGLRHTFPMASVHFIRAQVIGSDSGSGWRIESLDRGAEDKVRSGQIVLGMLAQEQDLSQDVYQMFVVGKIKSVAGKTSTLQLLNDSGFKLKAYIKPRSGRPMDEPWRAEGVLQGEAMGGVVFKHFGETQRFPIQRGDPVMARSDAQWLPSEMMVGTVQSCHPDDRNPVIQRITVAPPVDLHTLRQVVIIDTRR